MTDRSADLGSAVTSGKRARALVMSEIGVAAGLLQLLLAPLHGRAIDWAARKGQERRRRRDESEGRG